MKYLRSLLLFLFLLGSSAYSAASIASDALVFGARGKILYTWFVDKDTVWSGFSRTNTPGTTHLSTINTDWTEQTVGTWFTCGGGVLALKVTSAGAYTVAPNISVTIGNGGSGHTAVGKATANLSGTSLTVPTLTNMGQDYISAAPAVTLSGGTGAGGALAIDTINSNVLECLPTGATGNKFGQYFPLYRAAVQGQRIDVSGHWVGDTNQFLIAVCRSTAAGTATGGTNASGGYYCWLEHNAGIGGTPTVLIDASSAGASFTQLISVPCTGITSTPGHLYQVSLQATGTAPTTLQATVNDYGPGIVGGPGTTGTPAPIATFTTSTVTDSTAALQGTGSVAVGLNGQSSTTYQTIDEMTAYTLGGFAFDVPTVPLNNATQAETLTGIGTNWLTSTPTITVSNSGSAVSIVSQNIVDDTHISMVISTGASVGTATFTDPSNSATTPLTVATMSPPAVTINSSQTSTPVITAGGPATNGVPPYTYVLYRSPNSNLNTLTNPPDPSGDPSATIVNTQSSLSGATTPTAYTDSSPLAVQNYYVWKVTDAQGQVAWATQAFTVNPSPTITKGVMVIGDSISAGHDATDAYCQWIVAVDVTSGGSSYSNNPTITLNNGANPGSGATFACSVVGGVIVRAWVVNPGSGYTNETATLADTFTVTDGTGSGAVLAVHSVGGGYAVALKRILQTLYGYPDVNIMDRAVGGATSNHWQTHGTTSNTTYDLENAESAAGSAAAVPVWIYMIGTNDIGGISAATYTTHVQNTVTALKAWAGASPITIILIPPIWCNRSGAAGTLLLQQFGAACQSIAAGDPSHVICLSPWNTLNIFQAHPEMLANDSIHPINSGYGAMAGLAAPQVAPIIGLVTPVASGGGGNNRNGGGPLTMTLPEDTQTVRIILDDRRRRGESAITAKARQLASR